MRYFLTNFQVSASQKFRRFMVYVHAKGMIVDDEYVILGSANINQRSLAGSRDTEIAMGAYQPHYTWGKKGHPHGQVRIFTNLGWIAYILYCVVANFGRCPRVGMKNLLPCFREKEKSWHV